MKKKEEKCSIKIRKLIAISILDFFPSLSNIVLSIIKLNLELIPNLSNDMNNQCIIKYSLPETEFKVEELMPHYLFDLQEVSPSSRSLLENMSKGSTKKNTNSQVNSDLKRVFFFSCSCFAI